MPRPFDANAYWSARLQEHWDLQGVGHQEYPPSYNRWLYRRKRAVLRRALRGRPLDRALDLGSGTGWVIRQLQALGAREVEGCELSADAVSRLRASLPGVTVHHVDVGTDPLPAPDDGVDVVTMLDVAYHVVDDDALAHALSEIGRVLRRDGVAVVTDGFGGERRLPAEHVVFRSRADWDALLRAAHLELGAVRPYFGALSHPRHTTWRRSWHPAVRGPIEWAMDTTLPIEPWLRLAVLTGPRHPT